MICSIPAATASLMTYSIAGRSTTVTISLGIALLAGKNRVPSPATGRIAFLIIKHTFASKNYLLTLHYFLFQNV